MVTPQKILAIKLRALGDTVLMTAALSQLKKAYPRARIDVLVPEPWAPVLERHPAVDRIWPYARPSGKGKRLLESARLALKLRKERYDAVVNFHASPSSARLARATGAKTRSIHFHGHQDPNRYSTVTIPGKGEVKPVTERDMDALRALGLSIPAGALPELAVTDAELDAVKPLLESRGATGPVLGIGIGASRPTKTWPIERFARIAVRWCRETNGSALCLSAPNEAERNRQFVAAVERELAELGDRALAREIRSRIWPQTRVSVRALAALLKLSSLYLGNDSGPKHVAAAVGTPTVTLFGPEDPFEWHPYPRDRHPIHFIEGLACRNDQAPGMPAWCGLQECTIEAHRCMRLISEDDVFQTLKAKLASRSPL